jgi:hypothetical protein
MLTIRCTQKLLKRWPKTDSQDLATTTVLGDWYANILLVEPEVVLFINEPTLLCVPVPILPMHDFYKRFVEQTAYLLHDIGVPVIQIREAMEQMQACQVGPTQSMSKVTSMNYMMWRLEVQLFDKKSKSLEQVALRLSEFPLKLIGFRYPREVGVELFKQAIHVAP